MCVNYITVSRQICFDWFRTPLEVGEDWREEIYQDYEAPFIIHDENGNRKGLVGSYGFVPQRHRPKRKLEPGEMPCDPPKLISMATMNARAEDVGTRRHYKKYWFQAQLCLVPAMAVFEPNYESGKHERWAIGMADKSPFAMPGMWRSWEESDGSIVHSFTQFTVNADDHELMRRFHKLGEEKRSVVMLRPEDYDEWLACKNPELARAFLNLLPPEEMAAYPAPKPPKLQPKESIATTELPTSASQQSLF